MRLLLLGKTGQVGEEMRRLPLLGDVEIVAPDRGELDLRNAEALAQAVAAQPWGAVINAAAYTDVERAESEEPLAVAVNADAPARLAAETAAARDPAYPYIDRLCVRRAQGRALCRRGRGRSVKRLRTQQACR